MAVLRFSVTMLAVVGLLVSGGLPTGQATATTAPVLLPSPIAPAPTTTPIAVAAYQTSSVVEQERAQLPLAGRVVVIDAGHQLGNHNYPRKINALVPAGGFKKACNTTGTATNGGYPEATFNFRVARLLRARLQDAGARVIMTRTTNREDRWGPCIDVRGRAGNQVGADLKISIHGDGNIGGGPGFHVIAPTDRKPWTHDIHRPSRRLATGVRAALRDAGLPVAGYTAGGDGLDFRSDLGTLNLSNVPTVVVECGNMRSPRDARRMTSATGQTTYARALARAVRRHLR